jgi:hypothetical protein
LLSLGHCRVEPAELFDHAPFFSRGARIHLDDNRLGEEDEAVVCGRGHSAQRRMTETAGQPPLSGVESEVLDLDRDRASALALRQFACPVREERLSIVGAPSIRPGQGQAEDRRPGEVHRQTALLAKRLDLLSRDALLRNDIAPRIATDRNERCNEQGAQAEPSLHAVAFRPWHRSSSSTAPSETGTTPGPRVSRPS